MARTIYLPNNRTTILIDLEKDFQDLIREYMGSDCEQVFLEILTESKYYNEAQIHDAECAADEYRAVLDNIMEEISSMIDDLEVYRASRFILYKALKRIVDIIDNSL